MRPLLLVALLCVPPNIAAFGLGGRPSLGARPLSPQPAALAAPDRFPLRATVPRCKADEDTSVEADVGPGGEFQRKMYASVVNFRDRLLDPFNAKSYLTGRSLIQSAEMAFVAGQKVAGQTVADGLVQSATVAGQTVADGLVQSATVAGQTVSDGLVQSATVAGQTVADGLVQVATVVAFVIISVAPTVSTWMKSVLWVGAAVWAAWKQQR